MAHEKFSHLLPLDCVKNIRGLVLFISISSLSGRVLMYQVPQNCEPSSGQHNIVFLEAFIHSPQQSYSTMQPGPADSEFLMKMGS